LTDFDKVWHADASPPSKIQDGDGGHLEKSKNLNIFATNSPILTKFGMPMRLATLDSNNE